MVCSLSPFALSGLMPEYWCTETGGTACLPDWAGRSDPQSTVAMMNLVTVPISPGKTGFISRSRRSFAGFGEDEFVTAQAGAFGSQLLEHKATAAVEVKDLLRLGNLERISANPIDSVPPG